MMNSNNNILEEILEAGKVVGNNTCIGYEKGESLEGLTANLISISKLCDNGMHVSFSKDGCIVNNICDQIIMKGVRSADKCYMWTPIKALLSKKSEDANLWHKKLGHTNFKNIQELIVATSDDDR
ncbi:hypothetical protein LIER_05545 [Lithospermum erythrorhizon]|uniref:GAG-pre-integrase domain-containing protein n=1 Tax=Lithospermum erythrorhizon TaxID=34254 RepID=A0AAV3P1G4_LITER